MIYLRCKYDIISVPFIRKAYIICEANIIAISSREAGFHPPKADFTEKALAWRKCFFMARPRGFEPLTYRFVAGHSIR